MAKVKRALSEKKLTKIQKEKALSSTPDAAVIAKSFDDAGLLSEDPAEAAKQIETALENNIDELSGEKSEVEPSKLSRAVSNVAAFAKAFFGKNDEVPEEDGESEVLTQSRLNTANPGHYGSKNSGALNNESNYLVKIIDTETKKEIPIYTFDDTSRLSRGGQWYKSVVGEQVIPQDLMGEFRDGQENFSPWECVNALGLYNTMYMKYRVMQFTSVNFPLDTMEDDYVRNEMTFRGYRHGGASNFDEHGNPIITYERIIGDDGTVLNPDDVLRASNRLGVGVGECTVLNPPYQFNKRDDPRTNPFYPKIGRVYSTQIMNNWPIVLFQPGRLKYNTGFFKMLGLGVGAGATESLIRSGGDGLRGIFDKLYNVVTDAVGVVATIGSAIFGGGKVVEFKQSILLYKQYLHFLLEDMAGIMGLTDPLRYYGSVEKLQLEKILPIEYLNGGIAKYWNAQFIPFRCSKDVTSSESFSNSMDANPLMEKFNSQATEAESGAAENDPNSSLGDKIGAKLKTMGMKFLGSFSEQALVLSGRGRISLPDVFSSSSFSRSISLEFKFHCPYGDTLGQFENEYMQLMFLLAMAVPRQTGKLTYTSPFAVRVFVKNHIMINYGMIESLTVTRGGDNNDWCPNGFPKTLSVSVSIKDCEPNISLPMASRGPLRMALEVMFPASGISEYLSSIGGLPLDQMTHNWRKGHLKRATAMFTNSWAKVFDKDNIASQVVNNRLGSAIFGLISGSDSDVMNKLGDGNLMNAQQNFTNTVKQEWVKVGLYNQTTVLGSDKPYKEAVIDIGKEDQEAVATIGATVQSENFYT